MVAGAFVVKHELAGTALVIVHEVPAVFNVICAPPAVGIVSVALNRTRVALVAPDRLRIVNSIFSVLPTTTCGALNDFVNIRLLLPEATTTNVSVAVGPAVGVCVLVTPVVTLTYDAAVADSTRALMTQDEFAGMKPPVRVNADAPAVAVSVPPQEFVVTVGVTFLRLADG